METLTEIIKEAMILVQEPGTNFELLLEEAIEKAKKRDAYVIGGDNKATIFSDGITMGRKMYQDEVKKRAEETL